MLHICTGESPKNLPIYISMYLYISNNLYLLDTELQFLKEQ